jgi:hypothetical protein
MLIIRSHECVRDGFEHTHSHHVLTLFSASNYCGVVRNAGAYMKIPKVFDFVADSYFLSIDIRYSFVFLLNSGRQLSNRAILRGHEIAAPFFSRKSRLRFCRVQQHAVF